MEKQMQEMAESVIDFQQAEFVKSATKPIHYPDENLPEVAVMGRSNVGKSSLMNSLFNRRDLVKVSRTPGRTQLINFFVVEEKAMIVDLPGYGYAKVPTAMRRQWRPMIERYLRSRRNLLGCLLLLDIRRIPNEDDLALWEWLHHFDMMVIPVLTKADKLSTQQASNQMKRIGNVLDVPVEAFVLTSSKTHKGRDKLRRVLSGLCWDFVAPPPFEEEWEEEGEDLEAFAQEDEHDGVEGESNDASKTGAPERTSTRNPRDDRRKSSKRHGPKKPRHRSTKKKSSKSSRKKGNKKR